jgi:ABA sandwich protein
MTHFDLAIERASQRVAQWSDTKRRVWESKAGLLLPTKELPVDIDVITPGPLLDGLIHERVMRVKWDESRCRICGWPLKEVIRDGCTKESCSLRPAPKVRADTAPNYSTDLETAWIVVEALHLCVHRAGSRQPFWWVGIPSDGHAGMVADVENPTVGTGETAPLAICRSALKIETDIEARLNSGKA